MGPSPVLHFCRRFLSRCRDVAVEPLPVGQRGSKISSKLPGNPGPAKGPIFVRNSSPAHLDCQARPVCRTPNWIPNRADSRCSHFCASPGAVFNHRRQERRRGNRKRRIFEGCAVGTGGFEKCSGGRQPRRPPVAIARDTAMQAAELSETAGRWRLTGTGFEMAPGWNSRRRRVATAAAWRKRRGNGSGRGPETGLGGRVLRIQAAGKSFCLRRRLFGQHVRPADSGVPRTSWFVLVNKALSRAEVFTFYFFNDRTSPLYDPKVRQRDADRQQDQIASRCCLDPAAEPESTTNPNLALQQAPRR